MTQQSHKTYEEFAAAIDEQNKQLCTIRGLMDFKWARVRNKIAAAVSARAIVKPSASGAMSFALT